VTVAAVVTSTAAVVVIVPGAESLTGGRPALVLQGIAGVSAVPGRCQLILTCLVTDGERRVFSRVPQTGITLDLRVRHTQARIYYGPGKSVRNICNNSSPWFEIPILLKGIAFLREF